MFKDQQKNQLHNEINEYRSVETLEVYTSHHFLQSRSRKNAVGAVILLLACIIYSMIHEVCPFETDSLCVSQFLKLRVKFWVMYGLISASLFVLLGWLALHRYISRLYLLAELILLCYLILLQGHVMSTRDYQLLFQIFEVLFIVLAIFIISLCSSCYYAYKRFRMRLVVSVIAIFTVIAIYAFGKFSSSCNNWKHGLNEEIIDQSDPYCNIVEPSICWYDLLHGVMDASKIYDCTKDKITETNRKYWREMIERYIVIPEGTRYIELPRTEYFNSTERSMTYEEFQPQFWTHLQFHKNKSTISAQAESYLDLEEMNYRTLVVKNDSLVQQRKELFNQRQNKISKRQMPKNIIVLYVDAISRARFIQKLPKSVGWFEEQSEVLQGTHTLFQAFRYMSVAFYTFNNYLAFEYGIAIDAELNGTSKWSQSEGYENAQLNEQNETVMTEQAKPWHSATADLKDAGYVVAKARSQCGASIMEHQPSFQNFIEMTAPDHEFAGVMCDPNYSEPMKSTSTFKGPYSILRKCLYGPEINSYLFSYGRDFLTQYSESPKYLEMQFLDSHEGSGEAVNYFDDPMIEFLRWMEDQGIYEDSMIMMVSDHGLHMQGLYYLLNVDIYKIEVALPGMFILIDNSLLKKQQIKELKNNQQKVVTFFEVYYFLQFLIQEDSDLQNKLELNSLVSSSIDPNRDCRDIPLPNKQFCACSRK